MRKRKLSEWQSIRTAWGSTGRVRANSGGSGSSDALMLSPWAADRWSIKPSNISLFSPNHRGHRSHQSADSDLPNKALRRSTKAEDFLSGRFMRILTAGCFGLSGVLFFVLLYLVLR